MHSSSQNVAVARTSRTWLCSSFVEVFDTMALPLMYIGLRPSLCSMNSPLSVSWMLAYTRSWRNSREAMVHFRVLPKGAKRGSSWMLAYTRRWRNSKGAMVHFRVLPKGAKRGGSWYTRSWRNSREAMVHFRVLPKGAEERPSPL